MKRQELVVRFLAFLFFLLAGITWVSGEVGQGLYGRLTVADVFGTFIIAAAFIQYALSSKRVILLPQVYLSYLPLVFLFLIGVLLSSFPDRGALEALIHVFILLVSIALANLAIRADFSNMLEKLLVDLLRAGAILAVIGLLHFFVFPQWFSGSIGGLSGTFRNTGQAGSFFGTYIAVLVPAFLVGLIKPKLVNVALLSILFLALVFTFKRAALIGLIVGVIFLAISMLLSGSIRDKKYSLYILSTVLLLAPFIIILYSWGLENIDSMQWRVEKKFGEDAAEQFSEGFMLENIRAALSAFEARPLLGVGLGNVAGIFSEKYEVHSTYLKILACGGILGMLAYCWFVVNLFYALIKSSAKDVYSRYLSYLVPMTLGLLVSWAYTYHLRKREFWVLVSIVVIAGVLQKRSSPVSNNRQ